MKTSTILSSILLLATVWTFAADEPTSNGTPALDVIAIAKAAVPNLDYDKRLPIVVSSTNGVSVVSFPRIFSPWSAVTNGPMEVARIWVDETTGEILPEAGTVPLSDEEVVEICRSPAPDIGNYLQGEPEIRRISSLTIATYFRPLATNTNILMKSYEFTIETRSRFLLGVTYYP